MKRYTMQITVSRQGKTIRKFHFTTKTVSELTNKAQDFIQAWYTELNTSWDSITTKRIQTITERPERTYNHCKYCGSAYDLNDNPDNGRHYKIA